MKHPAARMSVAEFNGLKRSKYRNTAVVHDGQRFDSKLERDRYVYWKNRWAMGLIAWFTRQVPFRLPGAITYRADFLIALKEPPWVRVEDCKGFLTQVARIKLAQVEELYGFKVEIIKDGGWR